MAHWSHYRNPRLTKLIAHGFNLAYSEAANLLQSHRDGDDWAGSRAANRVIASEGGTGNVIRHAINFRHV